MRKICLITGASTGIGAATARMAAKRGYYDLILTYNSDQAGAEAVAADAQAEGAQTLVCRTDVAEPAQISDLFARLTPGSDALMRW